MNRKQLYFLLTGMIFFLYSCSKDNLKKYEGDFSFSTKVTNLSKSKMASGDTIIHSTGIITEIDKSTLRINYGSSIPGDSRDDFFMLVTVDVHVDNDGNITTASGNYGNDLSATGKFDGTDKFSMIIEIGPEHYGRITANAVDGVRIQ